MNGLRTKEAVKPGSFDIKHALKNAVQSVSEIPKGVYGITSNEFGHTHLESAEIFLQAGIKIIQYREKKNPTAIEALAIKALCHQHGALFIVNDNLEIAVQSGADGLHLGQDDISIEQAKKQFTGIIGMSATSVEEAKKAQKRGASYLGVGAVFPSSTKPDYPHLSGEEFRRIRQEISIPIYAIGGITIDNISTVKSLGADGVAVISAVLAAEDPVAAGKEIVEKWNHEDGRMHHRLRE